MTQVRPDMKDAAVSEASPVIETDPLTKPAATPGEWLRANLFPNAANTLTTVVFAALAAWAAWSIGRFVFVTAEWDIVRVNLASLMTGNFPRSQFIRPVLAIVLVSLASGITTGVSAGAGVRGDRLRLARKATPIVVLIVVILSMTRTIGPLLLALASVAAFVAGRLVGTRLPGGVRRWSSLILVGGLVAGYGVVAWFGGVDYNAWGGLMLNIFLALAAITLCFPFGVLLALGRRSSFPAVRAICVGYIELIRGVPLVTLLLMGQTMLGFFLPAGMTRPGSITRALVAFVLFAAAYVAEDVRGGLQGVPEGQVEAAKAIGLSPLKTTLLIVLPQALRNVIPALVGQFISLTKDTVLVAAVGQLDALRVARVVTQQPDFAGQGLHRETLLFAAFCFWAICFTMSRASQRLEKRLGVGTR